MQIVLVAPVSAAEARDAAHKWGAEVISDPGGLVSALNAGVAHLMAWDAVEYVGWLNDDDLLEPHSMDSVIKTLDEDPSAVVAFGSCRYIDHTGNELFVSKAGSLAPLILPWGPDLIPQPGMLVRSSAWNRVGGLDPSYELAFDLDLLLKLRKIGKLAYTGTVVSSFRWHPDSLTVEGRAQNLQESERAKRSALSVPWRRLAPLWEPAVRSAIKVAAQRVNRQAKQQPRSTQH